MGPNQWERHTWACQGKCPGRNTPTLAAALAVKSGNYKIIYQDILTALADASNNLPLPCHEQQTGAANRPNLSFYSATLNKIFGFCSRKMSKECDLK